jgi:hypothetical protein
MRTEYIIVLVLCAVLLAAAGWPATAASVSLKLARLSLWLAGFVIRYSDKAGWMAFNEIDRATELNAAVEVYGSGHRHDPIDVT